MKLFSVLHDTSQAEQIIAFAQQYPCLLDQFSQRHVEQFPTAAMLAGMESLAPSSPPRAFMAKAAGELG